VRLIFKGGILFRSSRITICKSLRAILNIRTPKTSDAQINSNGRIRKVAYRKERNQLAHKLINVPNIYKRFSFLLIIGRTA
jgi:hypothetical protein